MKELREDTNRKIYCVLDWKNRYCQYCQNDNTTQGNTQIQYKLYQINNGFYFFTELEQKFLICMETQKTLNSQSNLEKEKQSQKNPAP